MRTYRVINHNETLLGEFLSRALALEEAREYRRQTGNAAYVEAGVCRTPAASRPVRDESEAGSSDPAS